MSTVSAYAATSATEPLRPVTIERRDLTDHDVLIKVRYTGICHTDISVTRGEWGPVPELLVPGHEIVGEVVEVGSAVTRHQVGDRVGIGCLVDSCRECENCRAGHENHCLNGGPTLTYGSEDRVDGTLTQGGYSTHIVAPEDFVLRIPESIPYEAAGPLLCAGITTYSPLARWGAGPGKKVAVVGLGGLGHLAVKIARAMGAEVTVLSRTLAKKNDGISLGATDYYATSDPNTFEELAGRFDIILNTVSGNIDPNAYLGLLRFDGTLISVGASTEPLPVSFFTLSANQRTFTASANGSIGETQEMLDFCAEHGVSADIELIPAEQINEAFERVQHSDVRYRFVIDINTL